MKKKLIYSTSAIAALCLLTSFSIPVQAADNTGSTQPVPENSADAVQLDPQYCSIIEQYITGISSKWDFSGFSENNLCYLAGYNTDLSQIGYYLSDLDGNGTAELLIGEVSNSDYAGMFYDLYTMASGEPALIIRSAERDRYYLCSDLSVANEGSSSAFESFWAYYNVNGSQLQLKEVVNLDSYYDQNSPWFYSTAERWGDRSTSISESDADGIRSRYEYMKIPFTPLSQYESADTAAGNPSADSGSGAESGGHSDYLQDTEQKAAEIEQQLHTDASLTQAELTSLAGSLYRLWDDELNRLWADLKASLNSQTMDALTQEELQWIEDKETAMNDAAAQYEGGSLAPMEYNLVGAEWTKDRVYELIEYLP